MLVGSSSPPLPGSPPSLCGPSVAPPRRARAGSRSDSSELVRVHGEAGEMGVDTIRLQPGQGRPPPPRAFGVAPVAW